MQKERGEKREYWVDLRKRGKNKYKSDKITTEKKQRRLGLRAIRETAAPSSIETPLKHILRRSANYMLW